VKTDELVELLVRLGASGIFADFRILEQPGNTFIGKSCLAAAVGNIFVNEKLAELQIELDDNFPFNLPYIYLIPWNGLGVLPHIECNGHICYTPIDEVVVDIQRPYEILEEGLKRSIKVLEDGISGINKRDFIDEFDAYWSSIEGAIPIDSYIEPDDTIREIIAARYEMKDTKGNYLFVGDDDIAFTTFYNSEKRDKFTHLNAIYVPLPASSTIEPIDKSNLTPKNIRDRIIPLLSPKEVKILRRLARKYKSEEIVIFRIPRPSAGEVLFGLLFRGVHSQHPLMKGGHAEETVPLVIKRLDKSFLLPRGGANRTLQDKKVVVIGCGSVGGSAAFHLIQSGILNLTLIDDDVLRPENLFRHRLGKSYLQKAKAEALQDELTRNFPYVNIAAFNLNFDEVLEKNLIDLKNYDLLLFSIGNDLSSLKINSELFQQKTPPIIYTWLEPYGIGGHTLVTKNEEQLGCFQCLYTRDPVDDSQEFVNRASFANPGQVFTRDIAGCANRFTPYSFLDADKTAILAVRIAVQILLDKIKGNRLYSWKGDSGVFEKEGFKTSARYRGYDMSTEETGIIYALLNCPICERS
jgi:molybdopterin/thiamine biosynthesis adenylyltransferase